MARNESVATMVMFLCFGTAILSLAVHWHNMRTTGQLNQSTSTEVYSQRSPIEIGDSAIAASVPTSPQQSAVINFDYPWKPAKSNSGNVTDPANNTNQPLESGVERTQVIVDLSDRRVYVSRADEIIASYPIAIGKKGWETPIGNFQVIHKEHHPIWRHPITGAIYESGTDSPLGDRWIGFWSDGRNEIGFHGTPNVDLMGAAVSHGCLRMRNSDVRMLYSQVKIGTSVLVRD